jgi:hypothetical protein
MHLECYLWLVGVDPNIQITLETIRDEQLGISIGSDFKYIFDLIFCYSGEDL